MPQPGYSVTSDMQQGIKGQFTQNTKKHITPSVLTMYVLLVLIFNSETSTTTSVNKMLCGKILNLKTMCLL